MPISPAVKMLFPQLASLAPGPLQALATSAETVLVKYLGREISQGSKTQTFKGENQTVLWLNSTPVTSVDSVIISGTSVDVSTMHFDSDGRLTRQYQGFQNQLLGWTPGVSNIVVTYTSAGLDQSEQDMLIGSFMVWMLDMQSKSMVVSSESIGDYSYALNTAFMRGLPPHLAILIQPYRVMTTV